MSDNYTLLQRKYWIFDLDGTLTVAVHDFNAIRNELGIPAGQPI
ncbi:MAG TPA: HAD family hydrolase, partial [Deltaproteobacteria bacterium]|nr:HAD family hydrolase [Deltaproteobacteria bacterium]